MQTVDMVDVGTPRQIRPVNVKATRSRRRLEAYAEQLARAFEKAKAKGGRSAEYRAAHDALASFVRAQGGWIQVIGIRYEWDICDEAIRSAKVVGAYRLPPPVIV